MPTWLRSGTRSRSAPRPSVRGLSCSGKSSNNRSSDIVSLCFALNASESQHSCSGKCPLLKDSHALRSAAKPRVSKDEGGHAEFLAILRDAMLRMAPQDEVGVWLRSPQDEGGVCCARASGCGWCC